MREEERDGAFAQDAAETGQGAALLSIGALARLSGVPADTLRTWERRYGRPVPVRLPSGHRRYAATWVETIGHWKHLLERGFPASDVVGADDAVLATMLGIEAGSDAAEASAAATAVPDAEPRSEDEIAPADLVRTWIDAAARHDHDGLGSGMERAVERVGALAFAEQFAGPFLTQLGAAWADGRVTVAAEHAASERFRELVARRRRRLSDAQSGPAVVCATLPGERHDLGLQLAAWIAAVAGRRIVFLGADTPVVEIAGAVRAVEADALLLSVSRYADLGAAYAHCAELLPMLGGDVRCLVGGAGAPDVPGILRLDGFAGLVGLLRATPADQGAAS
ncbi:MAG: MerR family transcriptional regulator [Deltaproteobacteria bacterium]|nr:MerR family transcriptional regulator [Deltaproteobacteria bacterium]